MVHLFIPAILVALSWHAVSSLSILPSDSFEVGSSVTVTCSANSIDLENVDKVLSVELKRQLYTEVTPTKVASLDGPNFNTPGLPWFDVGTTRLDVKFPTEEEMKENNLERNIMKITADITNAQCTDSGHYFCSVRYLDLQNSIQETEENQAINGTVPVSDITLNITPDNGDEPFAANQTVVIMCTASAPYDYQFFWKRHCPSSFNPNFQDWFVQNDIKEHKREIIYQNGKPSQCGEFRHSQELTFRMTEELHDCVIRCEFGTSRMSSDNKMANRTVTLDGFGTAGSTPTPDPSTSSASNEDLVIGLVVGLLLVIIIVGAVLIYVFWWRKRKPEDKYKDEPDVGDPNQTHAPPPVYYTKPQKPPKDEEAPVDGGMTNKGLDHSYDSRDYANGGKPRYVNHEPISSGPPTYNSHDEPYDPHYDNPKYDNTPRPVDDAPRSREPYIGHQNSAYDGGDPDPNQEPRKYSRGRARSNRSDRLNSSRSTDDGSLALGVSDVNMGTAI